MKKICKIFLIIAVSTLIAGPVVAGSKKGDDKGTFIVPEKGISSKMLVGEDALVTMRTSFQKFAKRKVQHLNRNHQSSRSRMKITKQPGGLYCARFHQIDDSSLKFKVRRSKSKTIPYVGVLSYQEKVFEAFGATPEECKKGEFVPVSVTPNRHIFSFNKGNWK